MDHWPPHIESSRWWINPIWEQLSARLFPTKNDFIVGRVDSQYKADEFTRAINGYSTRNGIRAVVLTVLCFWKENDYDVVWSLNLFAIDLRPLRNGLGRDLPILVVRRILQDFDERRFPSRW